MDYIPTKIRKLLETKAKLNWQVHVLAGDRDEEDGMGWSDERSWNNSPSSRTLWRRMTRTGYRIIKGDILKQLIKSTYSLETDEEDVMWWPDQRDIKTIDQVHVLSRDRWKGWNGMIRRGILENNWTSSRTNWRRMKEMGWDDQMRDLKTIDQVHVLPGDGWRGWDRMIRWEISKQLTKFTYGLEKDEEDEMW